MNQGQVRNEPERRGVGGSMFESDVRGSIDIIFLKVDGGGQIRLMPRIDYF